MIIQIGTEVDESRILWKYKESDEWKRADIDDLICAYEDGERTGEWYRVSADKYIQHTYYLYRCSECGKDTIEKQNFCPNCGAKMGGDME